MNSLTLTTNYYHEHRDEIVNFVAMRIQDKAEAQDIVQDLFLRLLDGHRVTTVAWCTPWRVTWWPTTIAGAVP